MSIYNTDFFDRGIGRMGTRCEKWDVIRRDEGEHVLPLWVADMDFPSPDAVQTAILERAAHATYGYTEAEADDYQAVLDYWQRRHGLTLNRQQVCMLPCVVTGLKLCIQAFTQPGDGVIIQSPVYGPFHMSVEANGRKLLDNPLIPDENGRYSMDLKGLEALLAGGEAKLMLLCSPHNPVSRMFSADELTALLALLRKYNVPLVADEIHADFAYPEKPFVPLLALTANDPAARVVSLASASKTFNLAGLQQAMLFTRNADMMAAVERVMGADGTTCGNIFALEATRTAYQQGDAWLDALLAYLDGSRVLLAKLVAEKLPKAKLTPIEATYLGWIDLRAYGFTTDQLMEKTHRAGVAFTGGTFFSQTLGDGFLRVNFGCPRSLLIEGIDRLAKALEA